MRKEFNKLGEFNDTQVQQFEQRLGTYHVWHRQVELPQYASLMKEVASSIRNATTSQQQVRSWFETTEKHSRALRECHPINFSFEFMKSLTDQQLNYIENRFRKQQEKNLKRYQSRSAEERVERRLKNIEKWAGRIDFAFTASQRAMIRTALVNQISLRTQYYQLSGEWNKQLFILARQQEASDYDQKMEAHLARLWRLLESEYPQQWQANRTMWQEVVFKLLQSMNNAQRNNSGRWISKMGSTLAAIAKDEPSFTPSNDPSEGCLVAGQSGS